jgi:hypothetical protein
MTTNSNSERSSTRHAKSLRWTSGGSSHMVPPAVPRFAKVGSQHMLPTSNLSPNKYVFSSKHRLVKRNLPFFQSRNKLQVKNHHSSWRLFSLLKYDWFHIMLRTNMWVSLFTLLGLWTAAIIVFAGIYMAIDRKNLKADCGLGPPGKPIQFQTAFAFSLETWCVASPIFCFLNLIFLSSSMPHLLLSLISGRSFMAQHHSWVRYASEME